MNIISKFEHYSKLMKLKRKVKHLSPFLEKGIYTVTPNSIEKKFGFPFFIVFNSSAHYTANEPPIKLFYGGWSGKILAFAEKYVYSFYPMKGIKGLVYIKKYLHFLAYPKSEIYKISVLKLYTIAENVKGKSLSDMNHITRVAKDIIKYNVSAELFTKNRFPIVAENNLSDVPFYVQHGDLTFQNIIWVDDNNYKIIDLDTIDIYPCFYDLLRLMFDFHEEGLDLYLGNELDEEINTYIKSHNIQYKINAFKDMCLAAFILCTYTFWDTPNWVKDHLPKSYTKSNSIIAKLQ